MTDTAISTETWRARLRQKFEARKAASPTPAIPKRIRRRPVQAQQFNYGPPLAVGSVITIRIDGDPLGQPRVKAQLVKPKSRFAKPFIHIYTPDTAKEWKNAVRAAARRHQPCTPIVEPVRCSIDVLLPRPKYLSTPWYVHNAAGELRATCKPDRDNLDKLVLDTLAELAFWKDDAQVCSGPVEKYYHAIGEPAGARVTIEVLPPVPTPPKRVKRVEPTASLFPIGASS